MPETILTRPSLPEPPSDDAELAYASKRLFEK